MAEANSNDFIEAGPWNDFIEEGPWGDFVEAGPWNDFVEGPWDDVVEEGLWNDLPDLVIAQIFSYLSLNDRIRASAVCKSWSKGIESPNLWKSIRIWMTGNSLKDENQELDVNRIGSLDDFLCYEKKGVTITDKQKEELKKLEAKVTEELDMKEQEKSDTEDQVEKKKREKKKDGKKEKKKDDEVEKNKDTGDIEEEEESDDEIEKPNELLTSTLTFCDDKALQFSEKYGNYVKSLHLMCAPVSKENLHVLQHRVSQFLKSLTENCCELHELIVFFSYTKLEWEVTAKNNLIDAFCEFLMCQNGLETLVLGNCLIGKEVRLLEAMVQGSGNTIRNLHCLFHNDLDSTNNRDQDIYCKVLRELPNLQFIGLSFQSLNDHVISTLNNCKNLQTVYLYNLGINRDVVWRPVTAVPPTSWREPIKIQPEIENKLAGDYWLMCPEFLQFIPFKASVYENTFFSFQDEDQILEIIKYLRKNYCNNLVSLTIVTDEDYFENQPIETSITKLLFTCAGLRELKLKFNVSIELVEEIFNLQFLNKIDLQVFWFRCVDSEASEIDKLKALFKQYDNLICHRNWVIEIYEIRYKLSETEREILEKQIAEHGEPDVAYAYIPVEDQVVQLECIRKDYS